MRAEVLHDMERGAFLKSAPIDEGRHVFVTGLARAGTTILMREIYASGEFGSLTYADMPFVLAPNFWHGISAKSRKAGVKAERAHGDGIEVDFHSPEALDEVYWRVFSGGDYILPDRLVPHSPDDEILAGYRDFIRLVLRRTGKTRYLSKNNNNLLRLDSLAKAFPDSVILIPVRDPRDHALSLLNQHNRFLDSDAFTRDYMGWLGHHEFGATHRPFAWDGAIAASDPQLLRLLVVAVDRRAPADRGSGSSAQEYPARPLSGADERSRHLACRGAPYRNCARAAQGDPLDCRSETGRRVRGRRGHRRGDGIVPAPRAACPRNPGFFHWNDRIVLDQYTD